MGTVREIEDLIMWQKARSMNKRIFELTGLPVFEYEYALRNQMRRSSGSIMDNIAEGFGRMGNKEFINFLLISHGSLMEIRSQLNRCHDQGYISSVTHDEMLSLSREIGRMIYSMIQYLKKSENSGQRYRR
jgi:four helix bundle protein